MRYVNFYSIWSYPTLTAGFALNPEAESGGLIGSGREPPLARDAPRLIKQAFKAVGRRRASSKRPEWTVVAGWWMSDCVPPRLTASWRARRCREAARASARPLSAGDPARQVSIAQVKWMFRK